MPRLQNEHAFHGSWLQEYPILILDWCGNEGSGVVVGDDPFVGMVSASEGRQRGIDLREIHAMQSALPPELLPPQRNVGL